MLQHYLNQFDEIGAHTSELWAQQQKLALQRFSETGFPTIKDEKWRSIARSPFLKQPFNLGSQLESLDSTEVAAIAQHLPAPNDPNTLRFMCINGRFYLPLNTRLPEGLRVEPIFVTMQQHPERLLEDSDKAIQLGHCFHALNTLFSQEGLSITVKDHCTIEPTLELWYISTLPEAQAPDMFCTRHAIAVGKHSTLKLIEYATALEGNSQTNTPILCNNTFTSITLQANSEMSWGQSIQIPDHHSHLGQLAVKQHEKSAFNSESLILGSGLTRHTLSVDLYGPSAACELRGLTQVRKQHHVDHQLFIDHQADHTKSHVHYRAIADERGKASFGGEVSAKQGIHQMSSHQGNYNLLLSDDAEIITRPRLALWADDIECTHGATVGALDINALFYLRSRGLPEKTARLMLIQAFGKAILELMPLLATHSKTLSHTLQAFMQQEVSTRS